MTNIVECTTKNNYTSKFTLGLHAVDRETLIYDRIL